MRTLVLDANLAVLLVVGLAAPDLIGSHRRVRSFDKGDFDRLTAIVESFPRLLFTPNVLTETSNLARSTSQNRYGPLAEAFKALITDASETFVPSPRAVERSEFPALGLTDAGLLDVLDETTTLLTTDLDLHIAALVRGHDSKNFNHLRDLD